MPAYRDAYVVVDDEITSWKEAPTHVVEAVRQVALLHPELSFILLRTGVVVPLVERTERDEGASWHFPLAGNLIELIIIHHTQLHPHLHMPVITVPPSSHPRRCPAQSNRVTMQPTISNMCTLFSLCKTRDSCLHAATCMA